MLYFNVSKPKINNITKDGKDVTNGINLIPKSGSYINYTPIPGGISTEPSSIGLKPYDVIVFHNRIHVLGVDSHTERHYAWDGNEWIQYNDGPWGVFQRAYVINDRLFVSNLPYYLYLWNEANDTWETKSLSNIDGVGRYDVSVGAFEGSSSEYVHYIGGYGNYAQAHYRSAGYLGNTISQLTDLPFKYTSHGNAFMYNGKLHVLGATNVSESGVAGRRHWVSDSNNGSESSWTELTVCPGYVDNAFILNNNIYVQIGTKIYVWDESTDVWSKSFDIPFEAGYVAVLDDVLYLLGGDDYPQRFTKISIGYKVQDIKQSSDIIVEDPGGIIGGGESDHA